MDRGYADRVQLKDGALRLAGRGTSPADSAPLTFVASDRAYQIDVEVEIERGARGLLLFYNEKLFCGIGLRDRKLHAWRIG